MSHKKYTKVTWVIWSCFAFAFFLSFFHRIAPAVIVDHLMKDFNIGATMVGMLFSVYFYIYLIMQIPTGLLADTIGPRTTVIIGSIVTACGSFIFALSNDFTIAVIGRLLVGLGVSVAFICTLKVQSIWFNSKDFAMLMGVLTLVGTIASICATTPLALLLEYFNWRQIFFAVGILSFISSLLLFFTYSKLPRSYLKVIKNNQIPFAKSILLVWSNYQTWLCCLIHFAFLGTFITFVGLWGIPYFMQVYDFDRILAANFMIICSISYSIGAFFYASLSERILMARKLPLILSAFIFVIFTIPISFWIGGKAPIFIIMSAFIIISFLSSANIICFAIAKESNPESASGLAMASANGGILCAALLQPLVGLILDNMWQGDIFQGVRIYQPVAYQMGFLPFLIVGIMAFIASLFIKETNCTNIYNKLTPSK